MNIINITEYINNNIVKIYNKENSSTLKSILYDMRHNKDALFLIMGENKGKIYTVKDYKITNNIWDYTVAQRVLIRKTMSIIRERNKEDTEKKLSSRTICGAKLRFFVNVSKMHEIKTYESCYKWLLLYVCYGVNTDLRPLFKNIFLPIELFKHEQGTDLYTYDIRGIFFLLQVRKWFLQINKLYRKGVNINDITLSDLEKIATNSWEMLRELKYVENIQKKNKEEVIDFYQRISDNEIIGENGEKYYPRSLLANLLGYRSITALEPRRYPQLTYKKLDGKIYLLWDDILKKFCEEKLKKTEV